MDFGEHPPRAQAPERPRRGTPWRVASTPGLLNGTVEVVSSLACVALLWPLLAPDVPSPAEPSLTAPVATTEPADDYVEQAPLDVDTVINDSSRAYLHARARLEEHPELAAEAILDRLTTVPPPTSPDRKRLLDVLAVLGLPDHVELFARELRRGVMRAQTPDDETKAVDAWLPLVIAQGPAAVGPLTTLVADKELPISTRVPLLGALVEVTAPERVGELVTLVGRGARPLRRELQRALKRRASVDPPTRQALTNATDTALAEGEPARMPGLVRLRGALTEPTDTTFIGTLGAMAADDDRPFAVRVASLRALTDLDSSPAHRALEAVATDALAPPQRGTQRGELIAWLALRGMPPQLVRPLADAHDLTAADAPRLATVGFWNSSLAADQSWLAPALDNPWPQVRKAALARVQGPCVGSTVKLLEQRAHLAGRNPEEDRAVARSSIQALGRCSAGSTLAGLLSDADLDLELRAESARQLARLGDDASISAIAKVLGRNPERILARRMASALRHMPRATPEGDAVLCELATRADEAGHAARESLRALHGDLKAACQ